MFTKEYEIKEVVRLKDEEDLTWEEIADKFGFSERTARRRYQTYLLSSQISQNGYFVTEGTPFTFDRFKPLVRTGDCIISCDWHIPLHDPVMVNKLIKKARDKKIKSLIIGGDFLHLDSFSHFLPHQPEAAFEIEKDEATKTMKYLLKTFDEVDFIWGNHEHRISKFTNYKYSFEVLMRWIFDGLTKSEHKRLRISNLDHMTYKTKDRIFRVCHPSAYSKVPLRTPRALAHKYHTSVIAAHAHHCAIGVAEDGYNLVIEGGGLFDKYKTEYIQRTSTHHEWVQGFLMMKDNIPTLYSPIIGNI